MTEERPPEYDAELEVCGEVYFLRRSMALLRRLEQRYGPLPSLMRNLEAMHVTQEQLVGIVQEMLRGADDVPARADLAAWVWEEGTPKLCGPLAKLVGELCVGNRTLREAEERRRADREGVTPNPTRPATRPDPATG